MKFLIDECLSAELVEVCHNAGHEATHVTWVGKRGWKDWSLVRFALDGHYAIVTNNAVDFRRAYGKVDVHAGLLIIIPQLLIDDLLTVFGEVLRYIGGCDLTNTTIEVSLDDGELVINEYPLP
jgi:hypothetical protein